MKYRKFLGKDVSLLGCGAMRLPTKNDGTVDEKQAIELIRSAIDKGINYVDTAYMYHDGVSEKIVAKALKDGYREKVSLADKLPVWYAKTYDDLKKIWNEQMDRLENNYIDYYLMHNLKEGIFEYAKKVDAFKFLSELKDSGKVGHLGFSYHGESFELLKEIVDYFPFEFAQIQLNYMDKDIQAGVKGLKYLKEKGLDVIIMEPLKGGRLTDKVPASVQSLFDSSSIKRSPANWGLSWVSNFSEVSLILSGMSNISQLDENLEIINEAEPNFLSEEELTIINKASKIYNDAIKYPCTNCKYCLPCSVGIDIPKNLELLNEYYLYEKHPQTKIDYSLFVNPKKGPNTCTSCKECEGKCPQGLKISEGLKQAADIFVENKE